MKETRSTHRRGRTSGRLAIVLCLLLVVALLPAAASAIPGTITDANAMYLNSATITLTPACSYTLDGGPVMAAATSVTTPVYGAHVLALNTTWKDNATGTTQTVMTIPFFVDDDVVPSVTCDAATSYVTTASITMTATDNFNGSDIDCLYYRIDGGKLVQVVSDASNAATKATIARLTKLSAAVAAPPLDTYDQTPGHADYSAIGPCSMCHALNTPEPTSTPEPTGTAVPHGLLKTITVTGVGTHTIEYWTMDIARNESAHVTKTFAITAPAPVLVSTKVTMNVNLTSLSLGRSAHFFGVIAPNMPNGTPISFLVRKAGQTKWTRAVPYARTYSAHHWSYYYHPNTRGTYYFKVKFSATATFAGSTSRTVTVVWK
jgi:hypothetical protein